MVNPTSKFTRKPNRLPVSEIYRSNNSFFITICTQGKQCVFGMYSSRDGLVNGDTVVASTTEVSKICENSLLNIYELYENISLGDWVIMPNHIHFVITLLGRPVSKQNLKEKDLGDVIKSFKLYFQNSVVAATTVSPSLNNYFKEIGFNYHRFWQKSFYDHVIRNEKDLDRIQEYILTNPLNWKVDSLNPNAN
jgi:putative transposase